MAIMILDHFGRSVKTGDFLCGKAQGVKAYRVQRTGAFKVKAHDLGMGHLEVSFRRGDVAKELDWDRSMIFDHLEMMDRWRDECEEERRQRALKVAANRAKTRVRQRCKAMGADTLLTLTYKANETDLQRCKADLKEFNRRMLRVLPEFCFIAAFEHQDRGALHIHMATRRIPREFERVSSTGHRYRVNSYNVIRALWRAVTKDRQGNIDVQRTKRNSTRSPARIATYIAGYIIKEFSEGEKWSNRWTQYGKCDVPAAVDLGTVDTALEALKTVTACLNERHAIVDLVFSKWGDWGWLSAESPLKRKSHDPVTY
ncbi:rolling circle replication-associated protein [Variovorax sp.]|jgi:hypothetical protein|uniref:rolling circle replication-associated protein n=1 Tax=Variovorax sp. TaxID=1871043 RepID=UPI004037967F